MAVKKLEGRCLALNVSCHGNKIHSPAVRVYLSPACTVAAENETCLLNLELFRPALQRRCVNDRARAPFHATCINLLTTFTYILCHVVRMSRKHMVGSVDMANKMKYLRRSWTLPNDSKRNEASFATISTDMLYLRVAHDQMPRSPNLAIFFAKRPITLPLAHARGVMKRSGYNSATPTLWHA